MPIEYSMPPTSAAGAASTPKTNLGDVINRPPIRAVILEL